MKKLLLSFLLVFSWMMIKAQVLTNNGTITIVGSGQLVVEGGVSSGANSSIIVNQGGVLEVQGDLTLDGTTTFTQNGTLKFTGSNSGVITSAGKDLKKVLVNKSNDLSLNGDMTSSDTITLTLGDIVLGGDDLILTTTGRFSGGSNASHVNAIGGGKIIKQFSTFGNLFTFPIGNGTSLTKLESTPNGSQSGGTPSISVGFTEGMAEPNLNTTTNPNYLTRYWSVNASNISGYSNTLSGNYLQTDVAPTMNESLIKGAAHNGSAWNFTGGTGDTTNNLVGLTITDMNVTFTGASSLNIGTFDISVFLQGPYTIGTGQDTMTTALNYKGYLATQLTSPYLDKDFSGATSSPTVTSIPNTDITDWIQVQLINQSVTTDTIKQSAFLKKNGKIVGLDGSSLLEITGAYPNSIVRIVHRNHLPVKTDLALVTNSGNTEFDFTGNIGVFTTNVSPSINTGQSQKEVEPNIWAMWAGDVNQNGLVNYNLLNNDRFIIYQTIGAGNPNLTVNGYLPTDVNLDGTTKYNLLNNDRFIIYQNIGGGNPNLSVKAHN